MDFFLFEIKLNMHNEEIIHFLKFYLKCMNAVQKLMECEMINDFNDHFGYISTDLYPVPVRAKWNYDQDAYAIRLDFDLFGLPSKFNIGTICFDKNDGLILICYNNKTEVDLKYREWLTEESFFQSSLIYDFGSTDLQYWKKCIDLFEKIEGVMTGV